MDIIFEFLISVVELFSIMSCELNSKIRIDAVVNSKISLQISNSNRAVPTFICLLIIEIPKSACKSQIQNRAVPTFICLLKIEIPKSACKSQIQTGLDRQDVEIARFQQQLENQIPDLLTTVGNQVYFCHELVSRKWRLN